MMCVYDTLGYRARFAALLVISSVAAMVVADPSNAQSKTGQSAADAENSWNDPTEEMFQRPTAGPDAIAKNDTGMFQLQVNGLVQHPEFANTTALLDATVASGLKQLLGAANKPVFHAKDLKTISCRTALRVGFQPGAERPGRILFGVSECTVALQKPVDLSWLKKHVKSVNVLQQNAKTIYELTDVKMLSPEPLLVASRDDSTMCLNNVMIRGLGEAQGIDDFLKFLSYTATKNTSSWADAFRSVDGGIATWAIPHRRIDLRAFKGLGAGPDRAVKRIFTHCKTLAIGVDWSDESQIGIRIRLAVADAKAAKLMLNDVRMLHAHLKRLSADAKPDEVFNATLGKNLLAKMVMRQEEQADGSFAVDVRASAPLTLADVLGPMLAQ